MKKNRLAAALLALVLVLTACGGAGGNTFTAADTSSYNGGAFQESTGSYGWNEDYAAPGAASDAYDAPAAPTDSTASLPRNTKIIYSADLELETTEFDSAVQALDHIVAGLGGRFERRTLHQGGSYRSLQCTIRVPAEHFTALLEQAGQAAHMTYRQEYQDDVSESYYDNEARLTTQRTKLERLQALLAQAESMEDIITLESAISDTELQIEYLTGSLRHYDSLVDESTVTLSLREVYRLSTDEEPAVTFGDRMAAAFSTSLRRGVSGLEDLAVSLARNWVGVLALAAAAAVIAAVVRRKLKRRKARQAPSAPTDGQGPQT